MRKLNQEKNPMARPSKNLVTIAIIILCVVAIYGIKIYVDARRGQVTTGMLVRAKGNPKSSLHIVEYLDFQCPACAKGSNILREYLKNNHDKMYLELKYFPLNSHAHGFTSAQFAECAAQQGKFWPFHDRLIDKQSEWRSLLNVIPVFEQI